MLRAPVCSLILFDWPTFDLDKKGMREPPGGSLWVWRHFKHFLCSLGNSRGVATYSRCIQRDCRADPKCYMQHPLGDWLAQCYFTQIFLSRLKWFWGHKSLKVHWYKQIWIVLLVHCCHVKAVHHFYNLLLLPSWTKSYTVHTIKAIIHFHL